MGAQPGNEARTSKRWQKKELADRSWASNSAGGCSRSANGEKPIGLRLPGLR